MINFCLKKKKKEIKCHLSKDLENAYYIIYNYKYCTVKAYVS